MNDSEKRQPETKPVEKNAKKQECSTGRRETNILEICRLLGQDFSLYSDEQTGILMGLTGNLEESILSDRSLWIVSIINYVSNPETPCHRVRMISILVKEFSEKAFRGFGTPGATVQPLPQMAVPFPIPTQIVQPSERSNFIPPTYQPPQFIPFSRSEMEQMLNNRLMHVVEQPPMPSSSGGQGNIAIPM